MVKIFCTGCQRSGTRFYAKFLSKKHNVEYIDEKMFDVHYSDDLIRLIEVKHDFVVHCPALKHDVEYLKKLFPDCKIIWMYRDPAETKLSMAKIRWNQEAHKEHGKIFSLCRKYQIKWDEQADLLDKVIEMSFKLGKYYLEKGIIDELINMKQIENLEGFEKTSIIKK